MTPDMEFYRVQTDGESEALRLKMFFESSRRRG